tara:strand:+ start:1513 stop:2313 length:801 start_codon:yes stop_codon:yes gene_type:complete
MINIKEYNESGFFFPLNALDQNKVDYYLSSVYDCQTSNNNNPKLDCLNKSYLLFKWANSLIREKSILNHVSKILGPNLFCYSLNIFIKPAKSESFVSPHQDSSYWDLSPPSLLTAWIALTDVEENQGPVCYWSKTHKKGDIPFENINNKNNLLKTGQTSKIDFHNYKKNKVLLKSGQMSMHHLMVVHGSEKNTSNRDRVGVAIRYMSTNVKNTKMKKSAMLVSGADEFNNWFHETEPVNDLGKQEIINHQKAMRNQSFLRKITNFF